jgi:prevent-host-death family protein
MYWALVDIAICDGYNALMAKVKVTVAEAKNRLTKLIRAAEKGQAVTITRRGKPVADIVPTSEATQEKPKFGTMKDRIVINDPDWWKPMSDEEVEALLDGDSG